MIQFFSITPGKEVDIVPMILSYKYEDNCVIKEFSKFLESNTKFHFESNIQYHVFLNAIAYYDLD